MKTKDETYEMIMDVYKRNVPLQSEIANPFSANKRQRKKTLVPKAANVLPDDISSWNSKNFVDYFADEYAKYFSGVFKKTYSSDCSFINQIFDFMEANDLDRNLFSKRFIDWSFKNSQAIISKNNVFLLGTIKNHLNSYFQQEILDSREKTIQIDIFNDVKETDDTGNARKVMSTYGIPIAANYYINHKNVPYKNFTMAVLQLLESMSKGDDEAKQLVVKIIQKSISRGPYIDDFLLLDWREIYKDIIEPYKNELWYREQDYSGKPQYKLEKFLK